MKKKIYETIHGICIWRYEKMRVRVRRTESERERETDSQKCNILHSVFCFQQSDFIMANTQTHTCIHTKARS